MPILFEEVFDFIEFYYKDFSWPIFNVADIAISIGIILLWLSSFLTLYTGYDYLRKGIDHAISEDNKD